MTRPPALTFSQAQQLAEIHRTYPLMKLLFDVAGSLRERAEIEEMEPTQEDQEVDAAREEAYAKALIEGIRQHDLAPAVWNRLGFASSGWVAVPSEMTTSVGLFSTVSMDIDYFVLCWEPVASADDGLLLLQNVGIGTYSYNWSLKGAPIGRVSRWRIPALRSRYGCSHLRQGGNAAITVTNPNPFNVRFCAVLFGQAVF